MALSKTEILNRFFEPTSGHTWKYLGAIRYMQSQQPTWKCTDGHVIIRRDAYIGAGEWGYSYLVYLPNTVIKEVGEIMFDYGRITYSYKGQVKEHTWIPYQPTISGFIIK